MRAANEPLTVPKLQQRVNLSKGMIEKMLKFLLLESPAPIQKDRFQLRAESCPLADAGGPDRKDHEPAAGRAGANESSTWAAEDCLMQFLARS